MRPDRRQRNNTYCLDWTSSRIATATIATAMNIQYWIRTPKMSKPSTRTSMAIAPFAGRDFYRMFIASKPSHVSAVALRFLHVLYGKYSSMLYGKYSSMPVHEALCTTPAKAIGVADRTCTLAQLVDAALAIAPALPTETPPDRRRKFTVIRVVVGEPRKEHRRPIAESFVQH
jgi:hypothetical protein